MEEIDWLLKELNIVCTLGVSRYGDDRYGLFAWDRRQADRWAAKLEANGYEAEVVWEQGAIIVVFKAEPGQKPLYRLPE